VPDFQGGLAVLGQNSGATNTITKLDGITGQPLPAATGPYAGGFGIPGGSTAIHTDSTIFTPAWVGGGTLNSAVSSWLTPYNIVGLDPATGNQQFSAPLNRSTLTFNGNPSNSCTLPTLLGSLCDEVPVQVIPSIIAGDGYYYSLYGYSNIAVTESRQRRSRGRASVSRCSCVCLQGYYSRLSQPMPIGSFFWELVPWPPLPSACSDLMLGLVVAAASLFLPRLRETRQASSPCYASQFQVVWRAQPTGAITSMSISQQTSPVLTSVAAHLYVRDLEASTAFFTEKLGFSIDFVYGEPAFYGQVSRDKAVLALRHMDESFFQQDIRQKEGLLSASITLASADETRALFQAYQVAGVDFGQPLRTEPWQALTFVVKDLDGNLILFAGPAR